VLCRWKVAVRDERLRIGLLRNVSQLLQKTLDAALAMPADDVGRDLVSNAIGQNARKFSAGSDRRVDGGTSVTLRLSAVQKADMLGPRHVDQRANAAFFGQFQQPRRRCVIDANGVDADLPHLGEIASHHFLGGELQSVVTWCKRAIADALHPETIAVTAKTQAINGDPLVLRRWDAAQRAVRLIACGVLAVLRLPRQQSRHDPSQRSE